MLDVRFRPSTAPWPKRDRYENAGRTVNTMTIYDSLERELRFLGGHSLVIEGGFAAHQIRNDGFPNMGAVPVHPGVRVFFTAKKLGPLCYTMNRYSDWRQNLRAITLVLERQRLISQEGVGTGVEVYTGFKALPPAQPPEADKWPSVEAAARWLIDFGGHSVVFHPGPDMDASVLQDIYRAAARKAHPDAGGSDQLMARVNAAKAFIESGGGR